MLAFFLTLNNEYQDGYDKSGVQWCPVVYHLLGLYMYEMGSYFPDFSFGLSGYLYYLAHGDLEIVFKNLKFVFLLPYFHMICPDFVFGHSACLY